MTDDELEMQEKMRLLQEHMSDLFRNIPLPVIAEAGERECLMLPSEDGVKLETWLYFPIKTNGPFSTIAVRCCYPQQENMLEEKAVSFVRRGFGFAIQWCRGTHKSEGEWVPNINERKDGLSFMNALQEDPRVKNIGYWGDSYLALTGWCMADAVPSKVKTMCLGVYGCFRHVSAYKDGMFRQDILTDWAMGNAGKVVTADYMQSALYRPQAEVDEKMWGVRLDWYRDWITHTDADDPYWNDGFWGMLQRIPSKVKIPLYVRDGWYDHHLGSALCTWNALSEQTKAISKLEIGPWNHYSEACIQHQSVDNLEDDSISAPALWFDRILRRSEKPEEEIRLYEIGEDRFETYHQFPVKTNGTKELYFSALKESDINLMTNKPDELNGEVAFTYDPGKPVMSHGAESTFHTMSENGSLLQPTANYRDDIVSFISKPIDDNLHINGEIEVSLYVSSDVPDTSFTAKVMEAFDDGTACNIRGSITTLAYRCGAKHRMKYKPLETVKLVIRMWAIDWMMKKGSSLRVDIGSSDFPQYSVHTNYEGIWSLQTKTRIAHQTIYTGKEFPSKLVLPVIDYQCK